MMNDNERATLACRLAKDEGEKRYKYSQSLFNFQYKILVTVAKQGYLQERHQWKFK